MEIAEEDISIVLQQLPEEETGGTPIETIPPEGEIQTPPTDEAQQPGGENPTDPSDEGEPTAPESGDGENPTDPSDEGETNSTGIRRWGESDRPFGMKRNQLHQNPVMGRKQPTLRTERMKPFRQNPGDGEEATDSSNEEETTPPDDETDPSVGEGGSYVPRMSRSRFSQTVEQSTVSLTQDYQTGPDGELSEEPTTDSEPADESGTTENEGSAEPSGSEEPGNPSRLGKYPAQLTQMVPAELPTNPDNTGTGDNSLSGTEDGDQQGNDPTGSQDDDRQDGGPTRFAGRWPAERRPDRFAGRWPARATT